MKSREKSQKRKSEKRREEKVTESQKKEDAGARKGRKGPVCLVAPEGRKVGSLKRVFSWPDER